MIAMRVPTLVLSVLAISVLVSTILAFGLLGLLILATCVSIVVGVIYTRYIIADNATLNEQTRAGEAALRARAYQRAQYREHMVQNTLDLTGPIPKVY